MAKRLDDTEDRPPQDRYPAGRHPEVEAAEFEAEQPARDLTGLPRLVISVAAVAVSLYALFWVVRPQPAQPYRTSFLAVTLAMTLLAYRPLTQGGKATEEERAAGGGFRLVAVASPSEAVLDYYELEGRRVADHGWRRLEPAATPRLASLPLVATEVGRRTLVAGDRRLPLFEPGAAPAHLVLSVRR